MTKDYYQILDIPEFSTKEEIKSAYRKLVRKFHPDVAGNSADIVNRFKDINEAYEFLSDPIKKENYDKAKRFYSYAETNNTKDKTNSENKGNSYKNATKPNFKSENKKTTCSEKSEQKQEKKSSFSFNWEELFSNVNLSSARPKNSQVTPQKGNNIFTDIEISLTDSVNGTVKTINMLKTQVCPKCGGRKFVNGSECKLCHGKGEISEYKKFNVKIPAGIKDKSRIRLAGEGEKSSSGGKNGDLYLTVHILPPVDYRLDGKNILKNVSILPHEAVLGASIPVNTPTGKVFLKIAPNTNNGQKIRLTGCGTEEYGRRGDMIVTVEICIPKNLSEEELYLYKRLQEISLSNTGIQ